MTAAFYLKCSSCRGTGSVSYARPDSDREFTDVCRACGGDGAVLTSQGEELCRLLRKQEAGVARTVSAMDRDIQSAIRPCVVSDAEALRIARRTTNILIREGYVVRVNPPYVKPALYAAPGARS